MWLVQTTDICLISAFSAYAGYFVCELKYRCNLLYIHEMGNELVTKFC